MIQNLFPIPVGCYELGRDLTKEELSCLVSQQKRENTSNKTSINSEVLNCKELTQLRDVLENKMAEYFETVYKPKYEVNLRITQSWTNYTEPGQYHHRHDHFNSFVSGVFYVQADKTKDKIFFYKNEYKQIKIEPAEWNLWNSESWWIEVGAGDLIFFPSNLSHMVQTVETEQTRISLAFNTFPIGKTGDELNLAALTLG